MRNDLQIFGLAQLRTQRAAPLHDGLREGHVGFGGPVVVLAAAAEDDAAAVGAGELCC